MGIEEIARTASNFGFAGIVFVIWYFDQKKITGLQNVVKDQIEDKKQIRAMAQEYRDESKAQTKILMDIVRDSATRETETGNIIKQATRVLTSLEKKL